MLEAKPRGEGKYFSWTLTSDDDVEKLRQEHLKNGGYTVPMDPSLLVRRMPTWKEIQAEVYRQRNE